MKKIIYMQADKRSKSVKLFTKSTGGKRTRKVIRVGGQKKTLALFFVLNQDEHFVENIVDESLDV